MPVNQIVICNLSYVKGLIDGVNEGLKLPDFNIEHAHSIFEKAVAILDKIISDLEKEASGG